MPSGYENKFLFVLRADDLPDILNNIDSGTFVLLEEGQHVADAQIDLSSKTDITIMGAGRTCEINVTYSGGPAIILNASHRFVIRDVKVTSTVDQPFVQDTAATPSNGVWIDAIYIDRALATEAEPFLDFPSTGGRLDLTVSNCECDRSFDGANFVKMDVTGAGGYANRIRVLNNKIRKDSDAAGYLIHLAVESQSIWQCTVMGNQLEDSAGGIYVKRADEGIICANEMSSQGASGAITVEACSQTVIVGNTIRDQTAAGVTLDDSDDVVVVGNHIDNCTVGVLFANGATRCNITGNHIASTSSHGISLPGNGRNIMVGNVIYNAGDDGINIAGASSDNMCVGNMIADATTDGIAGIGGDGLFVGNIIYNPGSQGIILQNLRCTAVGNLVYSAGGNGIYLQTDAIAVGNVLIDSTSAAIQCINDDNLVVGNWVEGGSTGLDSNNVRNVFVGNYVRDTTGNGIDLSANADENIVVANFIYNVGTTTGDGIEMATGAQDCLVVANVINGNSATAKGIDFNGPQNMFLCNRISGITGIGIEGGDDGTTDNHGCIIGMNVVDNPGSYGMHLLDVQESLVVGNYINTPADIGLLISISREIMLIGNYVYDPAAGFDGIKNANAADRHVYIGNNVYDADIGINLDRGVEHLLVGNFAFSCDTGGFKVDGSESSLIGNYSVRGSGYGYDINGDRSIAIGNMSNDDGGIGIDSAVDNGVIVGNLIYSNNGDGIYQNNGDRTVISCNTIMNPTGDGIEIVDSQYCVVVGNSIQNPDVGVLVSGSGEHTILGNTITGATGISIDINAAACLIIGNYINNGGANGIDIAAATDCAVLGNYLNTIDGHGIRTASNNTTIIGNHVRNTTAVAPGSNCVEVTADNVLVLGNILLNSGTRFGYISSAAEHTLVIGNMCNTSASNGWTSDGDFTVFIGNYVTNSQVAFEIHGPKSAAIGNFIDDVVNSGFDCDSTDTDILLVGNYIYLVGGFSIDAKGDGVVIVGNMSISPVGPHFDLSGASRSVVAGNVCYQGQADGVYSDFTGVTGLAIVGNLFYEVSDQVIDIDNGNDVTVIGNVITQSGSVPNRGIIDRDGGSNWVVVGNSVNSSGLGIEIRSATGLVACNYVTSVNAEPAIRSQVRCMIIGNVVDAPATHGIDLTNVACSGSVIVGNIVNDPGNDGIKCTAAATDLLVALNQINDAGIGIDFASAGARCQIVNNHIDTTSLNGIVVAGTDTVVNGNFLYSIGTSGNYGISVSTGSYMTINDNKIVTVNGDGIFLNGVDYSQCNNNHVRDCSDDGIHLDETDETMVCGNRCYGNTGNGIQEDADCDNNLFGVNHLRGNTAANFNQNGTNVTTSGNKV